MSSTPRPFVFAIRPAYVEAILAGRKRFEYRTRRPALWIGDRFLIYETAPRSAVVAVVSCGGLICGSPDYVWEKTGHRGGISKSAFESYFRGRTTAVAIELLIVRKIDEPLALPDGHPIPQSWVRWRGPWPLESAGSIVASR